MSVPSFYLYGTAGCHLCEEAEALVAPLLRAGKAHLQVIEISRDERLMERYGIRIPVLGGYDAEGRWLEIGWPFEQAQVWCLSGQLGSICQGS